MTNPLLLPSNGVVLPSIRMLPSSLQLMLKLRVSGLLRRLGSGLTSPRRMIVSALAVALAGVWLGNAAASVLFREAYDPRGFRLGLMMILSGYGIWPILKAVWKRPAQAIEWSPAEKEFLVAGPFDPQQLITYRLCIILAATVLKSVAVALLLMPDLGNVCLGLLAMLLVLTLLELTRLMAEILFWGLPSRPYNAVRYTTVAIVGGLGLYCLMRAVSGITTASGSVPAAFLLMQRFFAELKQLFASPLGTVVTAPLDPFVNVMTASAVTGNVVLDLCIAVLTVAAAFLALMETDRLAAVWRRNEHPLSGRTNASTVGKSGRQHSFHIPRVRRWAGIGPLAWRQLVGTRRYPSSLAISLAIPALLSCAPLMVALSPVESFVNVAGSIAFYSFLLLPSALKFDFRRDCDRLAILKTLPVSPTAVVLGQLATPVGLTLLVQIFVLLIAFLLRPVSPLLLVGILALMPPVNMVIYGMENVLFLLFPHRLNEEGIQILLRSILLFTAKGILLAAALTVVFVWAISCHGVADLPIIPSIVDHRMIFVGGLWVICAAAATLLTRVLARLYARFDPSADLPG